MRRQTRCKVKERGEKKEELPQNSGLIKNTDLWSFGWFQSWHLMRRSRLQAICNMTWGARYSGAPRPTNERAEVSGYQPARTDPPLLGREELSVPSAHGPLQKMRRRLWERWGNKCWFYTYLHSEWLSACLAEKRKYVHVWFIPLCGYWRIRPMWFTGFFFTLAARTEKTTWGVKGGCVCACVVLRRTHTCS